MHIDLDTLANMLRYRRPHGSPSQRSFCRQFLEPVFGKPDEDGNHVLHLGRSPRVIFSSHHDTVHHADGMQRIAMVGDQLVCLHPEETTSNCLGADDAAGIWLQLRMIQAGVAGTYVVHDAEERGGLGSKALVESQPDWLFERDAILAFDRRGDSSVITHQRYGRCCSDAFADRVIQMLGPLPNAFRKDPYGSFTDSAHYPDHMQRTNLSCGYDAEHTRRESLDLIHLAQLSDRLCQADWSLLNASRESKHCA